jgi:hypothetical protein
VRVKTPKLKSKMGAQVQFCGHAGYFMADIFIIGNVAAVRANGPVTPGNIFRNNEYGPATHIVLDFPLPGLWAPDRGVFVVPIAQVKVLQEVRAA